MIKYIIIINKLFGHLYFKYNKTYKNFKIYHRIVPWNNNLLIFDNFNYVELTM